MRKGDLEVIVLHSGNPGGRRSRRQSAADDLQSKTKIQKSRGLTCEESSKDDGRDAP